MSISKMVPRIPTLEAMGPFGLAPTRFRQLFGDAFPEILAPAVGWLPSVEVSEQGNELVVTCELPGVAKENIEIVMQHNVLTIRGEKLETEKVEKEERRYLVYERSYGAFARSFTLPSTVTADKAVATFEQGLLTIRFPRGKETKDRTIPIK